LPGQRALVIAEKPSVARDLARVLGRFTPRQGWLENDRLLISWAIGHLVELAEPEDYDPAWKTWRLASLPILPEQFRLRPVARTRDHFATVAQLLGRPDVGLVVNACDAGREGELIFRYLYELSGCTLPVRRLWISSLTDEAIREGFRRLRAGEELDRLAAAARCRSESDWLVGINATRAMSKRSLTLVSVGRVQTPTLALLVQREKEIADFRPCPFWRVIVTFQSERGEYRGTWYRGDEAELWSEAEALEILARVQGKPGMVGRVTKSRRTQPPHLLHDLTDLQREMNRAYGFSASKTLQLAQELYERDKLITYPRTASRFLTPELVPLLPRLMTVVAAGEGPVAAAARELLARGRLPVTGRLVNPARVKDHHAIIPTPRAPADGGPRGDKGRIYEAVVRRFVASFLPSYVTEATRVETVVGEDRFRSEGQVVLQQGWRVLQPSADETVELPPLEAGMAVMTAQAAVETGTTRPPARYTEASLLRVMETAGSLVEEEDLAEAMREEGIGTPATRAAIIERLLEVGYVEREGRALRPTPKGMELIARLPVRELTSVSLTGRWERRLREIEEGSEERDRFMKDIRAFTRDLVEQIKRLDAEGLAAGMVRSVGSCPRCGAPVVERWQVWGCSNWKTTSCPFHFSRTVAGYKLSSRQAALLLSRGRTGLLRGFRSRTGRRFAAYLVLNSEGRLSFEFPSPAARKQRRSKRKPPGKG